MRLLFALVQYFLLHPIETLKQVVCFFDLYFQLPLKIRKVGKGGIKRFGHITASGLVIRGTKILLIRHPYIKKFIQPGGHIDPGELPIQAAIREVFEETGWRCKPYQSTQRILDLDIHLIPLNSSKNEGEHIHIDLCYLLEPIKYFPPAESLDSKWLDIEFIQSKRIQRAYQRAKVLVQAAKTSSNSVSS